MHLGILALHNKQQKTDEWKNKLLQSIRNSEVLQRDITAILMLGIPPEKRTHFG